MRKYVKMLTSKTFILGIILLVQLFFIFFAVHKLANNELIGVYVHFFFIVMAFFIVLHIITNNDNPTYKMAWLIPVLAFPVFGTFFYLFYHQNILSTKKLVRFEKILADRNANLTEHPNYLHHKETNYFNKHGWRDYKNTSSLFIGSGEEKFKLLIEDLKKAEKFIFLEYFIIAKGEMLDELLSVLIDKSKSGVEIKIIFDDFGSADRLPSNFIKKMKKHNIMAIPFNRMRLHLNFAMNYRDHRKIVVIDNKIGYTGGVNIGDEYINKVNRFGHWHDSAIRIEGQAVSSLMLIFIENWNFSVKSKEYIAFKDYYYPHQVETDGIIAPFADNPAEDSQVTRNMYLYLINEAKHEILITTPYLIFDNELLTALKLAANSGVSVKIVIPKNADKKLVYMVTESYAEELASADIEIFKYTPGFIHSKLLVVDNEKAIIGTTNLDFRSLYLHFENNIYLYKSTSVTQMSEYILKTINDSELQTPETLRKKHFIARIIQAILKGFAPIL